MKFRNRVASLLYILLLLLDVSCFSQEADTASFKVFLIGDAGESDTSGAILLDLQVKLKNNPNSAVIFLGDNCYNTSFFGIIPTGYRGYDGGKKTQARLMSQLNILRYYKGRAYFTPGNHDWWNKMKVKKGKKQLLKEQLFIEDTLRNFGSLLNHNDGTFFPVNGELGPVSKDVNGGKTKIIFFDTYRLILEEGNKHPDTMLLESFYKAFESELSIAFEKKQSIVIACHHPVQSAGKHSKELMFVEKINKRLATSNSNYLPYHKMTDRINLIIKKYNQVPLFFTSGHEHSLEYFYKNNIHYIISGSGSKTDEVDYESCTGEDECLQWNHGGFFEIDFNADKGKVLMYYRLEKETELKMINVGNIIR